MRTILALVALAGCGAPEASGPERLTEHLENWIDVADVVSARLVVQQCDRVVYDEQVGAEKSGLVVLGSTSKWVTAATLMTLVDAGVMELDAPLSTWLPELGPAGQATLRQALAHTSGMPSKHGCLKATTLPMRACAVQAARLRDPPGTAYRYGNVSYQVAAAAAEQAEGKPWARIFRERMAEPLGWTRTRYGVLPDETNASVAGSLLADVDEFSRFLRMILDDGEWEGTRVLSSWAVREMERGQIEGTVRKGYAPPATQGVAWPIYGLGVWRYAVDEDGGGVHVGASGKFGFNAWIDRERSTAGTLAVQLRGENMRSARQRPSDVRRAVREAFPGSPGPPGVGYTR